MMSDIEIIYELLLSEDYKDKLLLEITIDKIKDSRLAIGFLVELLSQPKWDTHKESVLEVMTRLTTEPSYSDYTFFKSEMGKYNAGKSDILINTKTILEVVIKHIDSILDSSIGYKLEDNVEFIEMVRNSTPEMLEDLKGTFLEMEHYESLSSLDKVINKK